MVDYEYYRDIYRSRNPVSSVDFASFEREAYNLVKYYSFNRVKVVTDPDLLEDIKITICKLVDNLAHQANSMTTDKIKSESIDSLSVTYADSESKVSPELQLYQIIDVNLVHSGLLYRGV